MSKLRQDDRSAQPGAEHTGSPSDLSSSFGSLLEEVAQASEYEIATPPSQDRPALPSSLGPYRILGVLGRGGMGVVYRAEHVETAEPAAVKTVRLLDESLLAGIRREIHVLARLRHPGVVRIFAEGLQDGLPWYAMELLEGVTLRRHGAAGLRLQTQSLSEPWWTESLSGASGLQTPRALPHDPGSTGAGAGPRRGARGALPLQTVLTLVRRVCGSLAFVHGEGIVHRDLKPENILVVPHRADAGPDWPVLMDFGLVSRFGGEVSREALDLGGASGGTVAYMAPEQARGDLVDARADLYALGCILYELLTGRPPFVGRFPFQVLQQHLEAEPLAPSQLVGGDTLEAALRVPPELDALLLRLLAKRPQDRLGHADDVAAALGRLGAGNGPEAAAPRARAYLYRPGIAGRDDVLQKLERHSARLKSGAGGVVLVGGESGVGKTRLVMEAARRAEGHGIRALAGECLALGVPQAGGAAAGGGLHPLRPALHAVADRCRERGKCETERLLGRRGKVLALYEPALAGLPGQEAYSEPEELPPAAARVRLFSDLAETFGALAAERPLLLVLDDLQWADALTLGFVEFLLRSGQPERRPLLVLGTYRSEELGVELQGLLESPEVERIDLKRLGQEAIEAIVSDMLALSPAPEGLARFLARQSEGNPFFVAEYLRLAVEEGVFFRDEDGRWQVGGGEAEGEVTEALYEGLPLPGSIRALVGRRLDGLPPEAAALAAAAAVLGREVPAPLLGPMTALSEELRLGGLAELLRRQVLEEAGPARFRFVHDKIREVAYSRIAEADRRSFHRSAAEALERLFSPEQRAEHLGALGHHWEEADEPARARACYLDGAQRAVNRSSFEEGAKLALHAKRLGGGAAAGLALADALLDLSRHDEALAEARDVARLPEASAEERVQAALKMAAVLERQADYGGTLAEAENALRSIASGQTRFWAHYWRSGALFRLGRDEEALSGSAEALALARQLDYPRGVAAALSNIGLIHGDRGAYDEALASFHEALAIERPLGLRRDAANDLNNIGIVHHDRGAYEEARACYEEALAINREIGHRMGVGLNLNNLGILHDHRGAYAEALAAYEEALAINREIGNRLGLVCNLSNIGCARYFQGQVQEALAALQPALAMLREIKPAAVPNTLEYIGYSSAALGRFSEAEQALAEAIEIAELHDNKNELALSLLARARTRLGRGYRPQFGREDAEHAQALWTELKNPLREGAALATFARYDALEGKHAAAQEKMVRARTLVPQGSDFNLYLQVLEDDAAVRLAAGDCEGAGRIARQAAELASSHGARTALRRIQRILDASMDRGSAADDELQRPS
jgi:serine/threonine protein kinase/tetratricopeptide (TPR) repeat protein